MISSLDILPHLRSYKHLCIVNETLIFPNIGCIRVFSRVRPFLPTDKRRTHQPISVESEKIVVRSGGSRKEFEFDKVFTQEAIQG